MQSLALRSEKLFDRRDASGGIFLFRGMPEIIEDDELAARNITMKPFGV